MRCRAAYLALLGCLACAPSFAIEPLDCLANRTAFATYREKGNLRSAAKHFEYIARHCRAAMQGEMGEYLPYFLVSLTGPEMREARLDLLQALFDSGFKFENGEQPSGWWRELVERRLEKKDIDGARLIAERIEAHDTLLAMRIDRRFDSLTQSMPERFDVRAAIQRGVARFQARVDEDPRSLQKLADLARMYRTLGRPRDAVALMDSALAAGEAKFDDWKEQYPWALTSRGFGYYELRKPSEALADLVLADEVTREGNDQASFVINLALTQVRLGKADDAMTTIDRVGSTSDFGALLTAHVYHMAHLSKGERALSEAALSRIRARADSAPAVYFDALLCAGHLQAAKQVLLDRLRDPASRAQALIEVQHYREPPPTAVTRLVVERKQQLLAMPDVRAAILEVGRIESFDFPEP
jgi:tetratricopeptide (TPR) repeat protein